jgi:hypothetical protein
MATAVEEIFAEMIERRPLLSPISSLRPPRQSSGSSQRRVRFAADCPAPTPAAKIHPGFDVARSTPRRRLERLERRFYTTPERGWRKLQTWRLWRLKPGLYKLVCCIVSKSAEAILRKAGSPWYMRVRLPRTMGLPQSATHLEVGKPGEDHRYPKGKAEWVRR